MRDTQDPNTAAEQPDHALYHRFLRGLRQSPDGVAVRLAHTDLTYRTAHELALRWGGALTADGRTPKAVGVLAEKNVTGYAGVLAALCTGTAAVPLNPGFPPAQLRKMLALADVSALIVDQAGEQALARIYGTEPGVPVLAPHRGEAAGSPPPAADACPRIPLDAGPPLTGPRPAGADDIAYVLFTSGSTGQPKGVRLTHGNLYHYHQGMDARYDFGPQDVFSHVFELNWDATLFDAWFAWGAGATLVPVPPHAYRDLAGFITEQAITVWFSTPSTASLVRRMGGFAPAALPTLRWSFLGGEAVHFEDANEWQRAASNSALVILYGPTEFTITITDHRWEPSLSEKYGVNGVAPLGRVYAGHDYVLREDDGTFSPEEGELCLTGPQITPGYVDPADGEGRFLDHDGRRWYRTGDRVRRVENGELVYLGRVDSQVQVQGVRVELDEVDHAVRSCDGIVDVHTTAASGPDGMTQLVVFYTGIRTSPVELTRKLRELLTPGMLPRHFVHLDALPLNANRKTDRPVLARRATALLNGDDDPS